MRGLRGETFATPPGRGVLAALGAATIVVLVALAGALPGTARAASFSVECGLSHRLNDDPIVYPGEPGAAHRHAFYGARGVHAGSTLSELRAAPTTCSHGRDTASYWAPELSVRGVQVRGTLTAYYSRGGKASGTAFPVGLKVVAGDTMAMQPQSTGVTWWSCTGGSPARAGQRLERVPACRRGERLSGWVAFPDCWDGRHTDSTDHRSHLAYARRGTCPASHATEIMKLIVRVEWAARPRPADVRLGGAMPATGMHADFWNAWHQPTLRQLRWDCIETTTNCGLLSR